MKKVSIYFSDSPSETWGYFLSDIVWPVDDYIYFVRESMDGRE